MGAGRKTKTFPLKEKCQQHLTGNFSAPARNLRKSDLGAVIFGCKNYTIQECLSKELFGLPALHFAYVKNIDPGLPLFLFNYSDRILHGIFEAASPGKMNINPYGWVSDGSETTPYAAQVRVRVRQQCNPLVENQFKKVIAKNYYGQTHFWFELDHAQTQKLISMFSRSPTPATSAPLLPNVDKWNHMLNIAPASGTKNGQWDSWDAPDAGMENFLLEGEKENLHAEPKCASSHSSVVASTNTCHQPKKWSSLFIASTSESKENDDVKTRGSELNVPPSNEYNTEWESSAASLWPEREHSNSNGQWDSWDAPDANMENLLFEGEKENMHVEPKCASSFSSVVGSRNTCNPPKMWNSLFKASTSESKENDDVKTQSSELNVPLSYQYNTEWEPSAAALWPEGGHSKSNEYEAEWESSAAAMWQEGEQSKSNEYEVDWESSHVSIWPEGEYSKPEEGDHIVDSSENLHHSEEPVIELGYGMLKLGEENPQSVAFTEGEEQCFGNEQFTDSTSNSEHSSKKVSPDLSVMANLLGEYDHSMEVESVSEIDSSTILSVVSKLVHGIQELKAAQLSQAKKISSLEQELVHSRLEVKMLKKQCNGSCQVPSIWDGQETKFDGSIYIVGGFDGSSWLSALGSYSPSLDKVKPLKPMSIVRSYASTSTLDGELFVFGGVDGNIWHDTVESYKPSSDQWVDCPPLSRRKGSLAGASLNGKIYAAGGGDGVECFSEVEMLDINTGGWVTVHSMLKKRFAPAAADINGVLYVAGGYDGSNYLNSVERFDHREQSWKYIASMSSKRAGHSLVVLNEKLYALGGYNGAEMVSSVEIFDPRLGTWLMGEQMNNPRGYCGAVTLGEKIYVIGGVEANDKTLDTIECYKEGCGWEATNLKGVGKRGFLSAVVL